ncbi:unnamed protein product [Lepeophtheirus salmonis]|uniref:(salmon louse) hypothetical protein n=1 Tax=Lepeophtheirus salmonis TaxID=72036 RepID=A0A7R8CRE3_LEPSM|nr:unnamed protein product [Lepeophtheirus salmonis]CAF2904029.1 unnamed protein product [Lepeophtheirus salmonis]
MEQRETWDYLQRKMKESSNKRFNPAVVGDIIMEPIDVVDCSRAEFSNIKAVVMEEDVNGTHKLGTKYGVLKSRYSRNQFTTCEEKFDACNLVSLKGSNIERSCSNGLSRIRAGGFQLELLLKMPPTLL